MNNVSPKLLTFNSEVSPSFSEGLGETVTIQTIHNDLVLQNQLTVGLIAFMGLFFGAFLISILWSRIK